MSHKKIRGPLFEARSVLLFTALALGGFGAASAQSTAPSAADQEAATVFAKADKNGDKALSAEEAKSLPAVSEQFTKIDSNGDGAVSEAEFMKAMKGS
ncbi:EF-hand domain-containing protein [Hydrogenophaga sp. PAMC20947]|uniref:EF-hand domain-containing protein n=1 Tax=Hydrogenophaga sp. PAMC20947 TaxID=2565558 RepID=UPI00109E0B7F|nr:EF-hand domain-containing protein [Hydrogenophaga sp. PAMC20947]QCB47561.1 EF-hand domain-containing protein [Hydrogenophaga sp. PAMC20947]